MRHDVRFIRNTDTGEHRAVCCCGWSMSGELELLHRRAASHDLDHLPDIPEHVPFASGLPDQIR